MPALIGGTVSAFAAWLILFLLLRSGLAWRIAIDTPNQRSLHVRAVPRVGGLIVLAIALAPMLMLATLQPLPIVAATLMAVCAVDDRRGLSVSTRLVVQLFAAGVASLTLLGAVPMWQLAAIMSVVIWSMNLYNFMDGSDGMAGGMTLFGFGAFAFVATSAGAAELALACGCIAGAATGFLVHNLPPARVFLGDAGSVPLGFLAGALGVAGWQQQVWPLWFPVLVFSPFIIDASVTLVRRAVAGKRVWEAHNEHLYQRMVTNGWGHAKTVLSWYAMMALAAGSAIAAVSWPIAWQITLLLGWLGLYAVLYASITRLIRATADEA